MFASWLACRASSSASLDGKGGTGPFHLPTILLRSDSTTWSLQSVHTSLASGHCMAANLTTHACCARCEHCACCDIHARCRVLLAGPACNADEPGCWKTARGRLTSEICAFCRHHSMTALVHVRIQVGIEPNICNLVTIFMAISIAGYGNPIRRGQETNKSNRRMQHALR